jgi:hypothetical protein
MAEEKKVSESQESEKETKKASEVIKTIFKYVLGGALVVLGILAVIGWWKYVWILIRGCLGVFLILAGLITIAIARE